MGDSRYFLYASKETKTLNDIRVSVFPLAAIPIPGTTSVTYKGYTYSNWFIEGDELHFVHSNPSEWNSYYTAEYTGNNAKWIDYGYLGEPSNTISITYEFLSWDSTTNDFTISSITQTLSEEDDCIREYLRLHKETPDQNTRKSNTLNTWSSEKVFNWYAPRLNPIVITDDVIEYYDQRGYRNEFAVDPETALVKTNPEQNFLRNPAFQIVDTSSLPLGWGTYYSTNQVSSNTDYGKHIYGNRSCVVPLGSLVYQRIRITERKDYILSVYATAEVNQSSVNLGVNFIDINGNYLDASGNTTGKTYFDNTQSTIYSTTKLVSQNSWTRIEGHLGPASDVVKEQGISELGEIPAGTYYIEVRIESVSNGTAWINCSQMHSGRFSAPFIWWVGNATIEYETAPGGLYRPSPEPNILFNPVSGSTNVKYGDIDLNPLLSPKPNGYLVLAEDGKPNTQDWKLGKGGNNVGINGSITDKIGRVHFPYAKTTGLSKWVERQTFHRTGSPVENEIFQDPVQIVAKDVEPIYPENSYINSSKEIHFLALKGKSTVLTCIFYDKDDNPIIRETVTVTITSTSSSFSTKTYSVATDQSGRARYEYTPDNASPSGVGEETISFSIGSVTLTYYADL